MSRVATRTPPGIARSSPGARGSRSSSSPISCPDCHTDLGEGIVNRRCLTCADLYQSFQALRDHIYAHGTASLDELAAASGVDIRTISRLIAVGYLRNSGRAAQQASRGAKICEVCKNPSDGTSLCATCRERLVGRWTAWQEEQAGGSPQVVAPALASAVPIDEEFAAMVDEENDSVPPEMRVRGGMRVRGSREHGRSTVSG